LVDANGNIIGSIRYQPDNPLACGAHVWIEIDTNTITVVPQEESQ